MKQVRPTSSDIRQVAIRARYAEPMRLRAFVERIEHSTGGRPSLKDEFRRCFPERSAQPVPGGEGPISSGLTV
jgi:hypothetical protein